jgi:hypothetical protein
MGPLFICSTTPSLSQSQRSKAFQDYNSVIFLDEKSIGYIFFIIEKTWDFFPAHCPGSVRNLHTTEKHSCGI